MKKDLPIREIISRVKHLEIRARRLVNDSLQSDYHSVFKGRGLEFLEVRGYQPGDDVRDIDWNVTARMGEPFIKTYIEERELSVFFACDISGSGDFGGTMSRRQMMAEITALLGFSAFFNHDRTGLFLFSDRDELILPARRQYSHLLRLIRDAWYFEPANRGTSLAKALESMARMLKKRTIIFLLSDFLDTGYEKALYRISQKHEVIPIVLRDPLETGWNNTSRVLPRLPFEPRIQVNLADSETGLMASAALSSRSLTDHSRFADEYLRLFKKLGLDYATVSSHEDYFQSVEMLLRRRLAKQRGSRA